MEHVGSILMPVDEVVFSLIAARDEALVREVNERAGAARRPDHGRDLAVVRAEPHRRSHAMTRPRSLAPRATVGLAFVAALAVAGCASGASPSVGSSALPISSLVPDLSVATTPAPSDTTASNAPSEGVLPSAVATSIDPCQLITSADASSWTGVKFGAGKESTTEGNIRTCNYDAAGPNLFFVAVGIAPDVATAKAAEAAQEADLQSEAQSLAGLGMTVESSRTSRRTPTQRSCRVA